MRILTVFVVVAGIVLIVGTIAFFVLLTKKREAEANALAERLNAPPISVSIPEEAKLADLVVDGDRALLTLETAEGVQFLLWLDLTTGDRLSLLRLDG